MRNRALLAVAIIEALVIVGLLVTGSWRQQDGEPVAMGRDSAAPSRSASEIVPDALPKARPDSVSPSPASSLPAREPMAAAHEPAPTWSKDDPLGIVMAGLVRGESGELLEAAVTAREENGGLCMARAMKGNGYALTGLKPGSWTITCSVTGYRPVEESLEVDGSAAQVRRDFVLEKAVMMKVHLVTPEGENLGEALRKLGTSSRMVIAVATDEPPPARLPMTEDRGHYSFDAGQFRDEMALRGGMKLPKDVVGILELKSAPPVYVSAVLRHIVLVTQQVTEPVEDVKLVVDPNDVVRSLASATLLLQDAESGEPITKGNVAMTDRQTGSAGVSPGPDGKVVLRNLAPGLLVLETTFEGYECPRHFVRLEPGPNDLGLMRLAKAQKVRGRVVNGNGEPVPANLICRNLDRIAFPQPIDVGWRHPIEADGTFEIANMGRGRHLVLATAEGMASTAVLVDTSGGDPGEVKLVLKPGTDVTIIPRVGPTERYLFSITDQAGLPVVSRSVWGPWPIKTMLAPGKYTLTVYDDRGPRRVVAVDVSSQPVRIDGVP